MLLFATDSTGGREAGGFITTAVKQEGGGGTDTGTDRRTHSPHTAPGGNFGVFWGQWLISVGTGRSSWLAEPHMSVF